MTGDGRPRCPFHENKKSPDGIRPDGAFSYPGLGRYSSSSLCLMNSFAAAMTSSAIFPEIGL